MTNFLAAALISLAIAISVFVLIGSERIWSRLSPPDLGPVAFENLVRRTSPNDALACPAHLCRAKSDLVPPLFAVNPSVLRGAMSKVIATEPRVMLVHANDADLTDRYVQRSAILGFPDTIIVRYLSQPQGGSSIAIYSRSQLGYSDLGVNKARIVRWLDKLKEAAPLAH